MDSVQKVLWLAQMLTIRKYVVVGGTALTLYDYILVLDDEIRYVWKGRKTWASCFYIVIRVVLVVHQIYNIYCLCQTSRRSKIFCLVRYHAGGFVTIFYVFSSEVFITLRIYAITQRNKILLVYFGSMALTRLAVWLASINARPPTVLDLPRVPVDAFNQCVSSLRPKFRLAPQAIGTAFDVSAFLVVVWCTYRAKNSALLRTIAADATIYFVAMVALQIYIQIAFVFMEDLPTQISFLVYIFINPILTLRFAVSLKRSADSDGSQRWQLRHFSTINFASDLPPDTQVSSVREDIELDPLDPLKHREQTREL